MWVNYETYSLLSVSQAVQSADFPKYELRAEEDVNNLTFNRIKDFAKLSAFQQDKIRLAIVEHIDFVAEYEEYINNPLASYGINGVSMSWDKSKVTTIGGTTTTMRVMQLLRQTGLTFLGVR